MMKKLIVFAGALAMVFFLPAAAAQRKSEKSASSVAGHHASGTITAWNEANKEVTIKNSAGKEETFTWSEKTKVLGTPKVGEHVKVEYAKNKEGQVLVTGIRVGAGPESKKMQMTSQK